MNISLTLRSFSLALSLSLLSSCGGGGGGGGGSDKGIRILHAALDAAPTDVTSTSKSEGVLQTARFGESTEYASLSTGDQIISLFRTKNSINPLYRENLTYGGDESYSLLLYGNNESLGLQTALLPDNRPADIVDGQAALRVVHALAGAAAINIEVGTDNLAFELPFGQATDYKIIPATNLTINIRRSSDGKLVYSSAKVFENQNSSTIVITGKVDYFVVAPDYAG